MTARTTTALPNTAPRSFTNAGPTLFVTIVLIASALAAILFLDRPTVAPAVEDVVPVQVDAWAGALDTDPVAERWGSMQSDTRARFPDVDAWAQGQERRGD
jgi:hypothetical protein